MSSMLYTYFLAASTTGAFLFNMALILFSAYAYPEEKNILTRRERDVRRTIFKTAVFEGCWRSSPSCSTCAYLGSSRPPIRRVSPRS